MIKRFILGLLGFGVVFFLVLSGITVKNHLDVQATRTLLDKQGVAVDATVFRKEKRLKRHLSSVGTGAGRHRNTRKYVLHLRFDANSEKGVISFNKALRGEKQDVDLTFDYKEITVSVAKSTYRSTKVGDKMSIKYLADDPSVYQHLNDKGEYHGNYRLFYAIGLFLLAGLSAQLTRQYHRTGTTW